ncbi:MAG: Ni/Fe-hydrogenase cytochrome b subunit [Candidatus Marinimicrobia bacterium]|nr:Ni/Fe-hydrogenase cytochrome b subunit [Candidatus Neomarinimicrobiota bacterium]MCF7828471.1 Ni/Fe-hydrogenase cytochrome b subunit [Candidatus Neomarinimicrobiota bacterium]MCF7881961.1 Ni/Fe-hydrogenase cytochrome b subunit [Candidatus Neomarinimicrobiota bacterium]
MSDDKSGKRTIRVRNTTSSDTDLHKSVAMGGPIMTTPFKIIMAIAAIGVYFMAKRFIFGIGAVSNLSHGYPWGVWIAYDVVVGTAIGSGGYAMALLVYIFNKGKYDPLVRSALLTAFLGYLFAGASIVIDTGRYWNLINMFLPQYSNITSSIMVEVALSVATYTLVLIVEISPAFLEKYGSSKLRQRLQKVIFIFIALGVLLPTLHQSSLGSMMMSAGDKLSPLWQTMMLPAFFLFTALIMGYAAVVVESFAASTILGTRLEKRLLVKLTGFVPYLILIYLLFRAGDLIYRGAFGALFVDPLEGTSFILENLLFVVPMLILFSKEARSKRFNLFISGVGIVLAGSIYRFNTYLIGFDPGPGWVYFPAFSEIFITIGLISFEIMIYMIVVKRLPILPKVLYKTA